MELKMLSIQCLLLLLFAQLVLLTNGEADRKYINEIEFKEAITSSQISLIHFHIENANNEYQEFLNGFFEASEYLVDFRIKLGVVDCNINYIEEYCTQKPEDLRTKVFVFRDGKSLTDLATDTLFDINSIVSSSLHLALLQEVPIVQNHDELFTTLRKSRAKQDVIFAKVLAIGTPEHRAFMEAAFAYGHRYKFLVTTSSKNVLKESDVEMWEETRDGVWLFQCHQALLNEECKRIRYQGLLRVNEFPAFMKALDIPLISKIDNGGKSLHMELKMPTVMLITKCEKFPEIEKVIEQVSPMFLGSVGFVIVDMNFVELQKIPSLKIKFLLGQQRKLPYLIMDPGHSYNGEFFEMHEGVTEVGKVIDFIENVLGETVPDDQLDDEEINDDENIEELQDDPVQDATYQERSIQHLDTIHTEALTDKTYPEFIVKKGLTTIFFHVKWDPRCLAFREPYGLAAVEIMEIKRTNESALARVNCFDWPDVCTKANVTRYPTIKMYKKGKEVAEYKGVLDEFYFLKYYLLLTVNSPIVLMTEKKGREFMDAKNPSWNSKYLDAFTIGFFPEGTTKERLVFSEVAEELRGQYLMASCVKDCAKSLAGQIGGSVEATVVTIKWEDVNQPEVLYTEPYTEEDLKKFVLESSEKIMPELNEVNFPFFMKKKSAFLMLFHGFDHYSESAEESLAEIAREKTFPTVQICWLDSSSSDTIGLHLLKQYDIEFVKFRPTIVLLDFKSQNLYHYGTSVDYRKKVLVPWIKKTLNGEIDRTGMLKEKKWTPLTTGYDFLSMIKAEELTEMAQMENRRFSRSAERMPEKDDKIREESSEEEGLSTGEDNDNLLEDLPLNEAKRHIEL
ncbi:thioredoxin domain-containing protein 16-like [Antedon mediterranea]|uniref:thioredoxin domain-containing protein 16-like n=1 Tax=Antedon mediterranea TaxID=105859 RepID=UPI003AF8F60B